MSIHIVDNTLRVLGNPDIELLGTLHKAGIKFVELGRFTKISCKYIELYKKMGAVCNNLTLTICIDAESLNEMEFMRLIPADLCIVRLIFSKKQLEEAINKARVLSLHEYRIFMCLKDSFTYSDMEWLNMIDNVKKVKPESIYLYDDSEKIVREEIMRLVAMLDHNISPKISIGIHALGDFSGMIGILEEIEKTYRQRDIFIDTAMLGVGDKASYPNTELVMDILEIPYDETAMMRCMDIAWRLSGKKYSWGYSPLSFVSAKTRTDIDYIIFLYKRGLHLDEIRDVVYVMDNEKRAEEFDEKYVSECLNSWQNRITCTVVMP